MLAADERVVGAPRPRSRRFTVRSGRSVHVIEAGDGPPLLLVHGSSTSALSWLPLVDRLAGVRAIAIDRPGFGSSEPAGVPRGRFREASIEFLDESVEALGLNEFVLAGNSMGGTWGLWYALARPERVRRLVLVGAPPLLPGTRPPAPLRAAAAPVLGDLMSRMKLSRKMIVRFMASMGEGDTIVRYPDLLDSLVAAGNDPVASSVNLAELRAAIAAPFGFRRSLRIDRDELRRLTVPTLLIWGADDPVASVAAAEAIARLLPEARLEVLPGGHVPYLGNPERVSALLTA
jgi:pimeloyl-ACP methyl ester carboxylesterase